MEPGQDEDPQSQIASLRQQVEDLRAIMNPETTYTQLARILVRKDRAIKEGEDLIKKLREENSAGGGGGVAGEGGGGSSSGGSSGGGGGACREVETTSRGTSPPPTPPRPPEAEEPHNEPGNGGNGHRVKELEAELAESGEREKKLHMLLGKSAAAVCQRDTVLGELHCQKSALEAELSSTKDKVDRLTNDLAESVATTVKLRDQLEGEEEKGGKEAGVISAMMDKMKNLMQEREEAFDLLRESQKQYERLVQQTHFVPVASSGPPAAPSEGGSATPSPPLPASPSRHLRRDSAASDQDPHLPRPSGEQPQAWVDPDGGARNIEALREYVQGEFHFPEKDGGII